MSGRSPRLVPNPYAVVRVVRRGACVDAVRSAAPVRGAGIVVGRVSAAREPTLARALATAADRLGASVRISPRDLARMISLGLLVPEAQVSRRVAYRAPLRIGASPARPGSLRIAAGCELRFDHTAPEGDGRARAAVPRGPARLWVRDRRTQAWSVFSVARSDVPAVSKLVRDRVVPTDGGLRAALWHAGVLATDAEAPSSAWPTAAFRARGYAVLARVLPLAQLAALRGYLRRTIAEGWANKERNETGRDALHDDPVVRAVHHQLTGLMSRLAGRALKPSYSYVGAYHGGSRLWRHTDRAQCEYSLSLQIDFSPKPRAATPWPLVVHPSGAAPVAIHLELGDALAYRGCLLPHSRPPLPAGGRSTSAFLHYVPVEFTGSLS